MGEKMEEKFTIDDLTTIKDILLMAIEREKNAYEFYMQALYHATTDAEKEMFERLAIQEKGHQEQLQKQLEEVEARILTDRAISGEDIE